MEFQHRGWSPAPLPQAGCGLQIRRALDPSRSPSATIKLRTDEMVAVVASFIQVARHHRDCAPAERQFPSPGSESLSAD